ncbi:hypothetical protein Lser_V15G20287 [Lactuca serriola]
MNTTSEEIREDGKQRRKSIGTPSSMNGGHGGGLTVSGGKTRRFSMGIPSSRKSIGEEGNIVPNYLRASTGSCHDFCKYGKKHEQSKSSIPIKFKRSTAVNKEKVITTTVAPIERKKAIKPFQDPKIQTPLELTKKDVSISLTSKTTQVLKRVMSANGKPKDKEVKLGQRSTSLVKRSPGSNASNGEVVKKKDTIRIVKKTGITPKAVKKDVVKGTPVESKSPKVSSLSRATSLKVIKHKSVKKVSPLKDQNIVQKIEVKQIETESEAKSGNIEFDYIHETVGIVDSPSFPSLELMNDPVSINGLEKDSMITQSVYESSKLEDDSSMAEVLEKPQSFSEVEENLLIAPPVSESSQSYYDDEVLEDESDFTDEETESDSDDEKVNSTENNKISRKGRMVISEDKDDEGVKLRFRRGKILDLQSENNGPRRLKFRKGKVMEGNEERPHVSRRSFEKKYEKETNNDSISNNGHENVVLKHQGDQGRKDAQGLFNNVIEETASKLVESRKSKVKALVGAFETVISLQDGKP